MSLTGRIHSFETFGTVDGPGIRFVVFMQGCPLRCVYCHNRDTWDPMGGKEYTSGQVITEMKKYLNYIKFSNGGITVTGGEPTLQSAFVTELFKKCRNEGIHTALDTNGFTDIGNVVDLLNYTDLLLLDIKHSDEEKHKNLTGVGTDKIKKFAAYTCEKNIPVWIRYVLIPGYTDSEEDLISAYEFIKSLNNVQKVELLPYHSMGAYKWDKLDLEYPLANVCSPTENDIEKARKFLNIE